MKLKPKHSILLFVMLLFITNSASAQQVTLSNNLLYDAALTPNLRVGLRLSEHWSMGLTAGYRPWPTNDDTNRKWKHLLLSPSLRYWKDSVNVHHFFGANVIYSHYNVADVKFPFGLYKSVRDERRQGDLLALGVFYGYSWPLGRHWNFEAAIRGTTATNAATAVRSWGANTSCLPCHRQASTSSITFLAVRSVCQEPSLLIRMLTAIRQWCATSPTTLW